MQFSRKGIHLHSQVVKQSLLLRVVGDNLGEVYRTFVILLAPPVEQRPPQEPRSAHLRQETWGRSPPPQPVQGLVHLSRYAASFAVPVSVRWLLRCYP